MDDVAPLRLGLIGCGRAAERIHLPVMRRSPAEVELVAVADPSPERRDEIRAGAPGCEGFESAEALLGNAAVDAVVIATPADTHVAVLAASLEAGVPALVEKPLARSLEGIDELEKRAAASDGWTMVGFNRRFAEPFRQLRRSLREAGSTTPVAAHLELGTDLTAWDAIDPRTDLLDDLGSHAFDLLRFVLDTEITSVAARTTGERSMEMWVRLEGRGAAHVVVAHEGPHRETMSVEGPGEFEVRLGSERVGPKAGALRDPLDRLDRVRHRLTRRRSWIERSYEEQLRVFARGVRERREPEPGLEDGIAAIRAVEAARRSRECRGGEVSP